MMMEDQCATPQSWSSLNETQRLAMVFELIQRTSLSEVRFLIEVLKSREADLTLSETRSQSSKSESPSRNSPWVDAKKSLRTSSYPTTPALTSRTRSPYGNETSTSEASKFEGKRSSASAATWRPLTNNLVSNDQQNHPDLSSRKSLPRINTQPLFANNHINSPDIQLSSTNTPLHPLSCVTPPYPALTPNNVKESINSVQLNLVRLTLTPEYFPPTALPKRVPPRKRRIPKYPIDATDPSFLGKWLRTLRLHKYEANLQGFTPRELLELNEDELKSRGVDTVGARKKLLAAFKEVKESLTVQAPGEK